MLRGQNFGLTGRRREAAAPPSSQEYISGSMRRFRRSSEITLHRCAFAKRRRLLSAAGRCPRRLDTRNPTINVIGFADSAHSSAIHPGGGPILTGSRPNHRRTYFGCFAAIGAPSATTPILRRAAAKRGAMSVRLADASRRLAPALLLIYHFASKVSQVPTSQWRRRHESGGAPAAFG